MNTILIILAIAVPTIVVAYIVWDLMTAHYTVKDVEIPYDKKIDKIDFDRKPNEGDRLSETEITERTQYVVAILKDILK